MRISDWSSDVCSSDLTDRRALSMCISDDLCAGGQPINAMLEHVFLWCRDRRIYGPSRKELERLVRSQRHLYLEALLARVRDRLAPDAVALLEASLADPDDPTGFNTMKGDAGQATLENILGVKIGSASCRESVCQYV